MGRLDIAAGHLDEADYDMTEALKIEPGNRAAQELLEQVETKRAQKK
jgi:hypothetical protein